MQPGPFVTSVRDAAPAARDRGSGAAGAAPPLEAEGLTRDFGAIRAVDHLSFRVERGQIVGLLGPNGAGKTTTLRMLTGSLIPTEGTIRMGGFDVFTEGTKARASLGYIPEQMPLYGEMSVRAYLEFVAQMKGIDGPANVSALEMVRGRLALDPVWERPTRVLSRGFRQRVGLAQALLGDPALLVLDEPTSGLDPNQIQDFRGLLRELGRGHAIILSTHILAEALDVCDRVIILNRGRMVAMDSPDRLAEGDAHAPRHVFARIRAAKRPDLGTSHGDLRAASEAGALDAWILEGSWSEAEAGRLLQHLVAQNVAILEWRMGGAGLEAVFRRLTLGEESRA
jgi:ABC-2 type transport system ATP-binding protein